MSLPAFGTPGRPNDLPGLQLLRHSFPPELLEQNTLLNSAEIGDGFLY